MARKGAMKLNGLRPEDRAIVNAGIRAREQGKSKDDNPYHPVRKSRQGNNWTAEAVWWDLGWEGAYE